MGRMKKVIDTLDEKKSAINELDRQQVYLSYSSFNHFQGKGQRRDEERVLISDWIQFLVRIPDIPEQRQQSYHYFNQRVPDFLLLLSISLFFHSLFQSQ